jgi:hypothetical protein
MAEAALTTVVSHWYQRFEGFSIKPEDFYETLSHAIERRKIPDASLNQIECAEGGAFSAKRLYLRVDRKSHYFDICGAPFGNGYFISWWLIQKPSGCLTGCLMSLAPIPYVRVFSAMLLSFFAPITYYRIDTELMFQSAVHSAVLEIVDRITEKRGVRALSESERKPIMRDFFQR